ncbi:MAG TPA: dihydroorotase [Myxococcales bacterium]|nr:dihydroorotase [Deltaproteobacteria bacterium]MBU51247.1 dihydroorotase [Deltaproteobacteria bacterium]HAA57086.1 dihydroorotase [Myxococcales bacterium]|tara:strand:+ start:30372 stop:31643 length:1272 start_codon:yes stop_codon:yes gene_type:complete
MRIAIRNTFLIDTEGEHGVGDLYIKDGLIEGRNLGGKVDQEFDAKGLVTTPAFLDLHAHLREPGQEAKEDLRSGLSAAAAGGYGTVVSMANTSPVIDEPGWVQTLLERAESIQQARLRPAATLSRGLKGELLTDFAALQEAGAVMITDDGIPVQDGHLMRRACEYAVELDLIIQTHSEDPGLRQNGVMNEGRISHQLGLPGNPIAAEAAMIYRDCEIALMTGARVHIAHISSKRGMQIVEWFKEQGANVTAEVTPHHLTLTDESFLQFDPLFKVAPPLRTGEDVSYLRDAVKRGVVDNIGTDHAPHTRAEKEHDLLHAPFGIANLEVSFALLYTHLVQQEGLPLRDLLKLLQDGPAKIMKWDIPSLATGMPADVVVLDLEKPREVTPSTFKSKAKWTPWDGQTLQGWPMYTFVRGQKTFQRVD